MGRGACRRSRLSVCAHHRHPFFGAGLELLAYAHVKALLLSVDVLLIIWAAFLLYRVADEAGAIRTIGQALPHLTNDIGMQALIIGWVFATFLQGVGGFGVPVAVIAPLLVGLGFSPLAAVVIPSIGHGWAVTFGSLGSSFQALIAATGVPGEAACSANRLVSRGCRVVQRVAGGALCAGLAGHETPLYAGAAAWRGYGGRGLCGGGIRLVEYRFICGRDSGLVICFPLAKRFQGEKGDNGKLDVRGLLVALSGYAILIVVILIVSCVPR